MHALTERSTLPDSWHKRGIWNSIASRSASYSSMQYVLSLLEVVEFVSYFVPTESFEASSCSYLLLWIYILYLSHMQYCRYICLTCSTVVTFVSHAALLLYLSHMQYCRYICLTCSTVIIFVSHTTLILFKTAWLYFHSITTPQVERKRWMECRCWGVTLALPSGYKGYSLIALLLEGDNCIPRAKYWM